MDYTSKIISLEKALSLVKSGDIIVTGLGAAEGGLFMENLHTVAGNAKGVKIVNCNPTHACDFYKPEYADTFSVDGWFYATPLRKAHAQGNMAFICTSRLPSGCTKISPISLSHRHPCPTKTALFLLPPPTPTSAA